MAHGYTPRDHYIFNEELDLSESRCTEFKAGPRFIKNDFRNNVGKYTCGFLNNNEDGTLMLGIEDSGIVKGYSLDRGEEDFIKLQCDEAMKDILPAVFPRDYSLRFVPVYDKNGKNHIENCYVIEIFVRGSNIVNNDRLYECKLGVFFRRDGSLEGPLRPDRIQEWTRQIFESKMKQKENDQRNRQEELENRISQLESERHQQSQIFESKMKQKENDQRNRQEELENRISQLESERISQLESERHRRSQSKFCAIM